MRNTLKNWNQFKKYNHYFMYCTVVYVLYKYVKLYQCFVKSNQICCVD